MSKESFWKFIGMLEADALIQEIEQSKQTVTDSDGYAIDARFTWPRHRRLSDAEARECHREAVAKLTGKRYAPPLSLTEDQVDYIEKCGAALRLHLSKHADDIGWATINGGGKGGRKGRDSTIEDYREEIVAALRKLAKAGISHSQACKILAARTDPQGNRTFPFSAEYMRKKIPKQRP